MCFRLQFPFQAIFKLIYCIAGCTHHTHQTVHSSDQLNATAYTVPVAV